MVRVMGCRYVRTHQPTHHRMNFRMITACLFLIAVHCAHGQGGKGHKPAVPGNDIPVKVVRLDRLKDIGDKVGLVYLDGKELKEFLGKVEPEPYDPKVHDRLLAGALTFIPIDDAAPDLGGFVLLKKCPENCKRNPDSGRCDCAPGIGSGGVDLTGCEVLLSGCHTLNCKGHCTRRVIRYGFNSGLIKAVCVCE